MVVHDYGDLDAKIERLKDCKHLTEPEVKAICEQVWHYVTIITLSTQVREILIEESNVQAVPCPVTVSFFFLGADFDVYLDLW